MKKFLLTTVAIIYSTILIAVTISAYPSRGMNYSGNGTFFGAPETIVLVIISSISLILAALFGDMVLFWRKKLHPIVQILLVIAIPFLLFLPVGTIDQAIIYVRERNGLF